MASSVQTQQQRYPCPMCGSTFTRPQHVVRHLRSHTGERPYKCKECGDSFARSDLLSRHVNKCHPELANANQSSSGKQSRHKPCEQCSQNRAKCDSGSPCNKCIQQRLKCSRTSAKTATIGQSITAPGSSAPSSFQELHRKAPFGPSDFSDAPRSRRLSDSGSTASSRTSLSTAASINSLVFDGVHIGADDLVPSSSSSSASRPPSVLASAHPLWSSRVGDSHEPSPSFLPSFPPSTITGIDQQFAPDATSSLYGASALQSLVSGASQFTTQPQPQSQSLLSHQSQNLFSSPYRPSNLGSSSTTLNPTTLDTYAPDVYASLIGQPSNTTQNPLQSRPHGQQQSSWVQPSSNGELFSPRSRTSSSEVSPSHNGNVTRGVNDGLGDNGKADRPSELSHSINSTSGSPVPFSDRVRAPHRPYNYIIGYGRRDPASANSSDAEYEHGLNSRTSRPSTAGSSCGVGTGSNPAKNAVLYSNPPASNSASSLSAMSFPPPLSRLAQTALELEANGYTGGSVGLVGSVDRSASSPAGFGSLPPASGLSQIPSPAFGSANNTNGSSPSAKIEEAPTEGEGFGVNVSDREEDEKENARKLKDFWAAWMAIPMYSTVSEKEAFIGGGGGGGISSSGQTPHALPKAMSMPSIKTPTMEFGTRRSTLGMQDVMTPRAPSQDANANVSYMRPLTAAAEDLSRYQEACMARETPRLTLAPRSRGDHQGYSPSTEGESNQNSPECGGTPQPSSTPSRQQQRPRQQQIQNQDLNQGRSPWSLSSQVQPHFLPTAPDTPLAKSNMTGQIGGPRPSYKRLPSQTLGPVDVKRTAFDVSAMLDGDEEAVDGDDEDEENDRWRGLRDHDHDHARMLASEGRSQVSSAMAQMHRRSMSSPSSTRPLVVNAFAALPGLGPDLSSRQFISHSARTPFPLTSGRVVPTTTTTAS